MRFQWIGTLSLFVIFSYSLIIPKDVNNSLISNNNTENKGVKYCSTCHTPGNTSSEIIEPLWLNENTEYNFETYSDDTHNNQHGFPSGETKLCLACHDGTVAVEDKNIYQTQRESGNYSSIEFSSHNNHPVSIVYNSSLALAKGDLADPSYEPSGLGGTIEEDLLENGKIVCTTCHAIHPTVNGEFTSTNHFNSGGGSFSTTLKISNRGSRLCLTCHKK